MSDIDSYYLGSESFVELVFPVAQRKESGSQVLFAGYGATKGKLPPNISTVDFKLLLQRMKPARQRWWVHPGY